MFTAKRIVLECLCILSLPIMIFIGSTNSFADSNFLAIEGNPLEIRVGEYGATGAFLWQNSTGNTVDENPEPIPGGPYLVRQYFAQYSFGSVLYLTDSETTTTKWGNPYYNQDGVLLFTPGVDGDHIKPDPWSVVTVLGAGDTGVQVTQTVTYTNGNAYYQMKWEIENTGGETFTDLRFFHGGDTYFAGYDSSEGHYDPVLNMVYLTNETEGIAGIMGLYGGVGSSADHYCETPYDNLRNSASYITVNGQLCDSVTSSYHDASYALQWNRATLAPGQTWTITAFEKWTEAGLIQVLAPAEQTIAPGQTANFQFVLQNFQNDPDTFDLVLESANGWAVSLPDGNSVTVATGASEIVNAQLTAPADAENGESDILTMTATSQSDESVFNSDATTANIEVDLPAQSGGTGIEDYRLISVPRDDVPGATLGAAVGSGIPEGLTLGATGDLRIFNIMNGTPTYEELRDTNPPSFPSDAVDEVVSMDLTGSAFWRIVRDTRNLVYEGLPFSDDEFVIDLVPGWNAFGFPFADIDDIDVGDLRVKLEGDEPQYSLTDGGNTLTASTVWEYEDRVANGGVDDIPEDGSLYDPAEYISRGYGYWLYAYEASELIIPHLALVNGQSLSGSSRTNPSAPGLIIAAAEPAPPAPPAGMSSQSSGSGVSSAAGGGGGGCFIDTAFFGLPNIWGNR